MTAVALAWLVLGTQVANIQTVQTIAFRNMAECRAFLATRYHPQPGSEIHNILTPECTDKKPRFWIDQPQR